MPPYICKIESFGPDGAAVKAAAQVLGEAGTVHGIGDLRIGSVARFIVEATDDSHAYQVASEVSGLLFQPPGAGRETIITVQIAPEE